MLIVFRDCDSTGAQSTRPPKELMEAVPCIVGGLVFCTALTLPRLTQYPFGSGDRKMHRHCSTSFLSAAMMPSRIVIMLVFLSTLGACQSATNEDEPTVGMEPTNDLSFAPTDEQRGEILATVQGVFDALAGDASKLSEVMMPDVIMRSNSIEEDGSVTSSTSTVQDFEIGYLEWIDNGRAYVRFEVMVSGPIATVWTPYDFYTGGEFSHCGIDVVTLLHTQEGWQIMSLDWTRQQPPACQLHPDGPPQGS
ncbi:MAG: hypothetical protein CM1200mP14_02710 [Gammaproteobacteria bacterium]|nr:MAG: hypothetical protein CM1200mP14_02710 [Gammaproteobacteria bacterium]